MINNLPTSCQTQHTECRDSVWVLCSLTAQTPATLLDRPGTIWHVWAPRGQKGNCSCPALQPEYHLHVCMHARGREEHDEVTISPTHITSIKLHHCNILADNPIAEKRSWPTQADTADTVSVYFIVAKTHMVHLHNIHATCPIWRVKCPHSPPIRNRHTRWYNNEKLQAFFASKTEHHRWPPLCPNAYICTLSDSRLQQWNCSRTSGWSSTILINWYLISQSQYIGTTPN